MQKLLKLSDYRVVQLFVPNKTKMARVSERDVVHGNFSDKIDPMPTFYQVKY